MKKLVFLSLLSLFGCGSGAFVAAGEAPDSNTPVSGDDASDSNDANTNAQDVSTNTPDVVSTTESGSFDANDEDVDCCSDPTRSCKGGCWDASRDSGLAGDSSKSDDGSTSDAPSDTSSVSDARISNDASGDSGLCEDDRNDPSPFCERQLHCCMEGCEHLTCNEKHNSCVHKCEEQHECCVKDE